MPTGQGDRRRLGRAGRASAVAVTIALASVAGCSDGGSSASSTSSPAPEGSAGSAGSAGRSSPTVRIVSQNLLHGIDCPAASDRCDLPGRVALFARQLDEASCPELVGLQEVNERTVSVLRTVVPTVCGGRYEIVWDGDPGLDREAVLTTLPVLDQRRTHLPGPVRTALWIRVAAGVGVVDLVTTHLASGSDDRPCDASTCPPPCQPDDRLNACQARNVVAFADEVAGDRSVVVVGGDLNATAGEPAVTTVTGAGFTDTHLAAGHAECDPTTGQGCTSGRVDDDLSGMTDPASRQSQRIDYLFVGGPRHCIVVPRTGLFNAEPATGGPDGLAFPSDHTGVIATLACPTTAEDQAAATTSATTAATVAGSTTVAPAGSDSAAVAAITEAFTAVFDGTVTDVDVKLAALQDGEALRPYFLSTYEATKAIASRVRVRIDDVALVDRTHADVTYTLLLDGSAVVDHQPGQAVQVDGRWLVSRRTYCDVSSQGATTIPPGCR